MAFSNKSRFRLLKSLHTRLTILIILIGFVPVLLALPIFRFVYQKAAINGEVQMLTSTAQYYSSEITDSGYVLGKPNDELAERLSAIAESNHGRIVIVNSSLKVVQDTNNVDIGKIIVWENIVKSLRGETLSHIDDDNELVTLTFPLTNIEGKIVGVMMLNKSTIRNKDIASTLFKYGLIVEIIACIICIILAFVISTVMVNHLNRTTKSLDDIISGFYTTIPQRHSYTELERIEDKTNEVIAKLQAIDESRQEFVSNVSHELKTPLTSMKVLADSLNASDDFPVEMYREFMKDIGSEIDRETKIINDLLALVKLDKTNVTLDVAAINMNELIELILKRLKPIADEASVNVIFESFRPVNCEVDEVKISLAITNLVENAIKYNNPGGWVHVTLNSDHKYCYIKVKDNGIGIPKESLDYIFERFYRADKSHSREIGGTGLGLAITKSTIVMHRGDIKVASTLGEGTEFDVRIPLNYIVEEGDRNNAQDDDY